jgi:hypothetical protein
MRGWSYFLGGYPSETEIMSNLNKGQPPAMTNTFWIYLSLFVVGFLTGIYYQSRNNDEHEMLKNDKNYMASDDNFNKVVSDIKKKAEKKK